MNATPGWPEHQTIETLGAWLAAQFAAGTDLYAIEEDVRLYVLALGVRGHDDGEVASFLAACGLSPEAAEWVVRTTARDLAPERNSGTAGYWVVMGRRLDLQHSNPGETRREAARGRHEDRMRRARDLARGDAQPNPALAFDDALCAAAHLGAAAPEKTLALKFLVFVVLAVAAFAAVVLLVMKTG